MNQKVKKYTLIAVEGSHDQAAIGKYLKVKGFNQFKDIAKNLDKKWQSLIPNFPVKGNVLKNKLTKTYIFNFPSIWQNDTHSIAIITGNGDELKKKLYEFLNKFFEDFTVDSFGLVIDADTKTPEEAFNEYKETFTKVFDSKLDELPTNIKVVKGTKLGIFVFPNNRDTGCLDTMLCKCADKVYLEHKNCSSSFIECIENIDPGLKAKLDNQNTKDKAKVATIVSVLKPGKTNQTSIADDDWICEETVQNVGDLKKLNDFLVELLDL